MGEVYRARDSRLDRHVAIKVLREPLTSDAVRRARFDREARVISQLNHPHICTLYDIGEYDDSTYLVFEWLEGETLASRLGRFQPQPLTLKEALAIGVEIVKALDAAHRCRIVHRDLKPSNIMLTATGAKLLDFGISKCLAVGSPPETVTAEGTLLGTVQYMAPEQLEGREADERSDLFAFGAVLYEMVTGRRAFFGETQANLIAAILDSNPPQIGSQPPAQATFGDGPMLEHVVQRCLAKDPDERWESAAELLRALNWIQKHPASKAPASSSSEVRQHRIVWGLTAALIASLLALGTLVVAYIRRVEPPLERTRFEILTPPTRDLTSLALSPDGRQVVFVGNSDTGSTLWIRRLDETKARPLPDTEDASAPFWAPDGSEVAFFARGKLRRIAVDRGVVQVIADAPSGRGGTWNADGVIVFAPIAAAGLMRVPAVGGTPTSLIDGGPGRGGPRWPQFLPDGRRFLFYMAAPARPDIRGVYVGSVDGAAPRRIMDAYGSATFVSPHWLFFEMYGALRAQRFDPERALVTGAPINVADGVAYDSSVLRVSFTGAANHVLAYRTSDRHYRSDLVWADRTGHLLGKVGSLDALPPAPSLSPDGKRIALARRVGGSDNIWIVSANGGTPIRLTSDPPGSNAQVISERNPIWAPDGGRIVFASARKVKNATTDLYERATNGSEDRLLLETPEFKYAESWSHDGRFLLYGTLSPQSGPDIWALPLDGGHPPFPVANSGASEVLGQFGPNDRWVAYQSNESGRVEIWVQSFPDPSMRMKVSVGGGVQPRWSHDGRELFYVAPDGRMMSVPIVMRAQGSLTFGTPAALFAAQLAQDIGSNSREIPQYDVAPDGRFLLVRAPDEVTPPPSINVIQNWNGESLK